jgi:thioredoxin-like negative regulator of GroEL
MDFRILLAISILAVLSMSIFGSQPSEQVGGRFTKGKKIIVLYYAPSCGHCTAMMPEWKKFAKKHKRNPKITVKKVNSDKHPLETKKANVEQFPTIILYKDGKKHIFASERRAEALEAFVDSV